jgi:protein-tyrosine-phosphatase
MILTPTDFVTLDRTNKEQNSVLRGSADENKIEVRASAVSRTGICPTTAYLCNRVRQSMPDSINIRPTLIRRRDLIVASLCLGGALSTKSVATAQNAPLKILFVCQAGTAKSAIAREIFRKRAMERGIRAEVFSRGLVIEDHISPELRRKLVADGINTVAEPAMPLEQADWAAADILVNFNPLPASVKHLDVRDWSDVPSVNTDYTNALALMIRRIDLLITEIAARKR